MAVKPWRTEQFTAADRVACKTATRQNVLKIRPMRQWCKVPALFEKADRVSPPPHDPEQKSGDEQVLSERTQHFPLDLKKGSGSQHNQTVPQLNLSRFGAGGRFSYLRCVQRLELDRHAYFGMRPARRLAESGIEPKVLQYIMGHANRSVTTGIYTHLDFSRLQRQWKRCRSI